MNLSRRSTQSFLWKFSVNILQMVLTFIRSVLLARWLPVSVFGIYAFPASLIALTVVLPNFGMGGAFLYRSPENQDEERSSAVHFTINGLFLIIWALLLAIGSLLYSEGESQTVFLVLIITTLMVELTKTPMFLLVKRIEHRRLSVLQLISMAASLAVSLILALRGAGIWALLSVDIVVAAVQVIGLYIWNPIWLPRLAWVPETIQYFLGFGKKTFLAAVIYKALDRLDDIWVGFFLGRNPMAYYSKAYAFSQIPGRVVADPLNPIVRGGYAELAKDREALSKAFRIYTAVLLRAGSFLGGMAFFVAPEFIRFFIGEKWLPMLLPFQLMLIFSVLDPVKFSIGNLFVAVGQPEKLVKARVIQLLVMVIGLFGLGFTYGITGIAIAVDIMIVVGLVLMFLLSREYVDYSAMDLFATPVLGLLAGIIPGLIIHGWVGPQTDLSSGLLKIAVYSIGYLGLFLAMEYKQITREYLPKVLSAIRPD